MGGGTRRDPAESISGVPVKRAWVRERAQAADVPLDEADEDDEDDDAEEDDEDDEEAVDFESDPVEDDDEEASDEEPDAFADDVAGVLLDEEPRLSFR